MESLHGTNLLIFQGWLASISRLVSLILSPLLYPRFHAHLTKKTAVAGVAYGCGRIVLPIHYWLSIFSSFVRLVHGTVLPLPLLLLLPLKPIYRYMTKRHNFRPTVPEERLRMLIEQNAN